jgi:glycine cleavage system H protein
MTEVHYTKDHEWVSVDGDVATVGITTYAADKLGDVVYVDLPAVGASVAAGRVVGEIESTKSMGAAWLIKVKFTELPALLSAAEYEELTQG